MTPESIWKDGHFYSPIPSEKDIEDAIRTRDDTLEFISFSKVGHEQLWREINDSTNKRILESVWKTDHLYPNNSTQFIIQDASMLARMLLQLKPSRIIEVGSGHSSAIITDLMKLNYWKLSLTCIEPFPDRLIEVMGNSINSLELIKSRVQDVDIEIFLELEAGDLLFIDSSHVLKAGSDVNFLFNKVFPRLRPGIVIHIHDIFKGFEYPSKWLQEGRAWTEAYLLRSFLMFNNSFTVIFWPQILSMMERNLYSDFGEGIQNFVPGSSFYMIKNH